jgi:hypothetical protein
LSTVTDGLTSWSPPVSVALNVPYLAPDVSVEPSLHVKVVLP